MSRRAPVDFPVLDAIAERWSPRAFEAAHALTDEQVHTLLEAARWAPSAFNAQPWRFIYGKSGTEAFDRILSVLAPFNAGWAKNASLLIITVAQNVKEDGKPIPLALYDVGQAAAHIGLQATVFGLQVHPAAGFDRDAARSTFGIPEGFEAATVLAIGKIGGLDVLADDTLRQRETAPRVRRALGETAFEGTWG